jgi:hypothetical protein
MPKVIYILESKRFPEHNGGLFHISFSTVIFIAYFVFTLVLKAWDLPAKI